MQQMDNSIQRPISSNRWIIVEFLSGFRNLSIEERVQYSFLTTKDIMQRRNILFSVSMNDRYNLWI